MRRMYSKEQLQRLIDEVSRLIAIEELDKVVPVPSLDKAGYLMQVNATGTGYQLKAIADLDLITLEGIKDSDGHNRFIEGNLTTESIEGITFTYAKWSLSGSHLMIVLAGNAENGTAITSGQTLASTSNLPSWILDKIYPTFNAVITAQNFDAWDSGYNYQTMQEFLNKEVSSLRIFSEAITFTSAKSFRIAYDLLIDNA